MIKASLLTAYKRKRKKHQATEQCVAAYMHCSSLVEMDGVLELSASGSGFGQDLSSTDQIIFMPFHSSMDWLMFQFCLGLLLGAI